MVVPGPRCSHLLGVAGAASRGLVEDDAGGNTDE